MSGLIPLVLTLEVAAESGLYRHSRSFSDRSDTDYHNANVRESLAAEKSVRVDRRRCSVMPGMTMMTPRVEDGAVDIQSSYLGGERRDHGERTVFVPASTRNAAASLPVKGSVSRTLQRAREIDRAMSTTPTNSPRNAMEWKRALAAVKRDHADGRYRQCASRCQDILGQVQDSNTVQKVHLIYLHFYAATALEMQVRSLQHSSPFRMKLLGNAREYYQKAAQLVATELDNIRLITDSDNDNDIHRNHPPFHAADSSPSRTSTPWTSPAGSRSSASSASSQLSSPNTSVSEYSPAKYTASSPSRHDHVQSRATSGSPRLSQKAANVHTNSSTSGKAVPLIVRPDSPTLGRSMSKSQPWSSLSPHQDYNSEELVMAESNDTTAENEDENEVTSQYSTAPTTPCGINSTYDKTMTPSTPATSLVTAGDDDDEGDDNAAVTSPAQMMRRYRMTLHSLGRQIAYHANNVESELSTCGTKSSISATDSMPSSSSSSKTALYVPTLLSSSSSDEMRSIELQTRILRLRANGWQRKRFDASRYETLRDDAMADMLE